MDFSLQTVLVSLDSPLKELVEQGGHARDEVTILSGYSMTCDAWNVSIVCEACRRRWDVSFTGQLMYAYRDRYNSAHDKTMLTEIIHLAREAGRTPCFVMTLAAELAEWLTQRVSEAGAEGVKLSVLVAEAVDHHLCAPQEVRQQIEKLEFRIGSPPLRGVDVPESMQGLSLDYAYLGGVMIHDMTVTLPYGHPLRKD